MEDVPKLEIPPLGAGGVCFATWDLKEKTMIDAGMVD